MKRKWCALLIFAIMLCLLLPIAANANSPPAECTKATNAVITGATTGSDAQNVIVVMAAIDYAKMLLTEKTYKVYDESQNTEVTFAADQLLLVVAAGNFTDTTSTFDRAALASAELYKDNDENSTRKCVNEDGSMQAADYSPLYLTVDENITGANFAVIVCMEAAGFELGVSLPVAFKLGNDGLALYEKNFNDTYCVNMIDDDDLSAINLSTA